MSGTDKRHTLEAWAIFGPRRQRPHLDKIMATAAEAWGLLSDEMFDGVRGPTNAAMRGLGYTCRKVTINWRDFRRGSQ